MWVIFILYVSIILFLGIFGIVQGFLGGIYFGFGMIVIFFYNYKKINYNYLSVFYFYDVILLFQYDDN